MDCRNVDYRRRAGNAASFRKGIKAHNKMPVGTEVIRERTERGEGPRVFVKTADPGTWRPRATVEWEKVHGPLPRGKLVHHMDRDTLNDAADNLQAMTRAEHAREHSDDTHRWLTQGHPPSKILGSHRGGA
jgi:hypothetical protein